MKKTEIEFIYMQLYFLKGMASKSFQYLMQKYTFIYF